VAMWSASFPAMLDALVKQSGIPQHVIEVQARELHRAHRTSEYAFLIESLPCLKEKHPGGNLVEIYKDAIAAYRDARAKTLALYPTVLETLRGVKARGVLLVGFTDSLSHYSRSRIQMLQLDGVLDYLYSPADHELPPGTSAADHRSRPPEAYEFKSTKHLHTPEGEFKPSPDLLLRIIAEVGADVQTTVYVGDSLMKDVLMAQQAKVLDVYADYGKAQDRPGYQILRRVTHWTDEDVEREKQLKARHNVHPTYTLHEYFSELLNLFEFGSTD
jgi:phosphoglycolate phosphatase-like HAD superfamily hydrolase